MESNLAVKVLFIFSSMARTLLLEWEEEVTSELESSELDKGGRIAGALTGFCIGLSVLSTLSFLSLLGCFWRHDG